MTPVTEWQKAKKSNGSGNCVEQRRCGSSVEVRDTKDQGLGPVLSMAPEIYRGLLATAKSGRLDLA